MNLFQIKKSNVLINLGTKFWFYTILSKQQINCSNKLILLHGQGKKQK